MRVDKLIEMLSWVDPSLDVELEGCDCTGACIGLDMDTTYEGQPYVLLVREGGLSEWDRSPNAVTPGYAIKQRGSDE